MDLLVLDNTGSSYMTLYDNDLLQLDVDLTYGHWGGAVTLSTANGNVIRTVVRMEITIKDQQGVAMVPWTRVWCVAYPGPSFGNTRCSGMFLRENLYTGTVPDGHGILWVGVKKGGVCGVMPVI